MKVVEYIQSAPRRVLALLAGSSLFWWSLADIVDLAGNLPLLAVTLLDQLWIIGVVFEWLLGVYAFYLFFPTVLPEGLQTDGFRVLAALITVGVSILSAIGGLVPSPTWRLLQAAGVTAGQSQLLLVSLFLILLIGGISIGAYVYYQLWQGAPEHEKAALVSDVAPTGPAGGVEDSTELLDILGVTLYLLSVCLLVGGFGGIISSFFPLPELLVLGVVGIARIAGYLPWEPQAAWFRRQRVDVLGRFSSLAGYATTSDKGASALMMIWAGLGLSIVPLLTSMITLGVLAYLVAAGFSNYQAMLTALLQAPRPTVIGLWNAPGMLICLVLPGFYALWYWLRVADRLPYFLARWEDIWGDGASIEDLHVGQEVEQPPFVTRPPDYLLLPTVVLAVCLLFVRWASTSSPGIVELGDLLFALVWPLLVVGCVWTVRRTYDRRPQYPINITGESIAYLLPILLQLGWIAGLATLQGSLLLDWSSIPMLVIILLWAYFAPETLRLSIGQRRGLDDALVFLPMLVLGAGAAVGSMVLHAETVLPYAVSIAFGFIGTSGLLMMLIADRVDSGRNED